MALYKNQTEIENAPAARRNKDNKNRSKKASKRSLANTPNNDKEKCMLKLAQHIMDEEIETLFYWQSEQKTKRGDELYTQLHYFCDCGFSTIGEYIWSRLEDFLQKTPNSVIRNMSNRLMANFYLTPLHLACKLGAPLSVVKLLVEKNPESLSCKDGFAFGDQNTPLHYACIYSSLEVVKFIIEKRPLSLYLTASNTEYGNLTPLHHACYHRASPNIIKTLVDKAPELTKQQTRGAYPCLPIQIAREKGASSEVIELLEEKYPDSLSESKGAYFLAPLSINCIDQVSWGVNNVLVNM